MPLTFGYLYDFRNPQQWWRPWSHLYGETLDLVAWTETVGFDGAWVPEHHGADDGYLPAPNVILAAMAARTSTIRLGAAIAIAPLYDPVRFAEECAVLDILAEGRLETGVAIGYRGREYAMFGQRLEQRGRRFDEFLQIVRALWAGETVNFSGAHYNVSRARITPPPPRGTLPLYLGGFTPRALDRVAEYGDGYLGTEECFPAYRDALRRKGKDPDTATIRIPGLYVTVAEDPERAMHELAPHYHHVYRTYAAWMAEDTAIGLNSARRAPMDLDTFTRSGILQILTPEQAVGYFRQLRDRVAVEHFSMTRPPGLPAERFVEYAQLFADRVIPALSHG